MDKKIFESSNSIYIVSFKSNYTKVNGINQHRFSIAKIKLLDDGKATHESIDNLNYVEAMKFIQSEYSGCQLNCEDYVVLVDYLTMLA